MIQAANQGVRRSQQEKQHNTKSQETETINRERSLIRVQKCKHTKLIEKKWTVVKFAHRSSESTVKLKIL